jgi:ATP:corrinoid adenosyltransferase
MAARRLQGKYQRLADGQYRRRQRQNDCALGFMMRAAGRGMNCCMIQFMKSKTDRYGEHESAETLGNRSSHDGRRFYVGH